MRKKVGTILLSLCFVFTLILHNTPSKTLASSPSEEIFQQYDCGEWSCGNSQILVGSDGTIHSIPDGKGVVQAFSPDGTLKWEVDGQSIGVEIQTSVQYYKADLDREGNIYIPYSEQDQKGLLAINKNGQIKWKFPINGESAEIGPIVKSNTIYASDLDSSTLYALNKDGSVKWKVQYDAGFSKYVSSADKTIYTFVFDNTNWTTDLYAIDEETGQVKWKTEDTNRLPAKGNFGVSSLGTISYLDEPGTSSASRTYVRTLDKDGTELFHQPLNDVEAGFYQNVKVSPTNDILVLGYFTALFNLQGDKKESSNFGEGIGINDVLFGQNAYYLVGTNKIKAVDPVTYETLYEMDSAGTLLNVAWGKDGKIYAYRHDHSLVSFNVNDSEQTSKTGRLSGKNRYETAVEISKEGWDTADTVVIARGDIYPDALVGTPLAYKHDAPILLTRQSSLPAETKSEIERLGATNVIILGGESAVSTGIQAQLDDLGMSVQRIAGKNRYETAAKIAQEVGSSSTAVVAYSKNFPDALAVSSYAAKNGYPILLSKKDDIPEATKNSLTNVTDTYVVGGTAVISDTVAEQLPNATRLSGKNRYGTTATIINEFQGTTDYALVATGQNFADALTGSVLAAKLNVPMLLVQKSKLPVEIENLAKELGLRKFTILGGNAAVQDNPVIQLHK